MSANTYDASDRITPEIGPQGRENADKQNQQEQGREQETRPVHAEGTRPPFADKNLAALKIGYRSPRVYGKVAEGILADLIEAMPVLTDYPEETAALASTEAVVALMRLDLAARGLRDRDGSPRLAFLDRYFRAESAAAKRRDALGLSPIGQAVLARERASAAAIASSVDLDALAARGREALNARVDIASSVLEEARANYRTEREAAAIEYAGVPHNSAPEIPALDTEAVMETDREDDQE